MMTRNQKRKVWALFGAVFVGVCILSEVIAPGHDQYVAAYSAFDSDQPFQEAKQSFVGNTPFQSLLPTVLGFREVLASLMWVQADDYFHRGEYRPIIQMIRQIVAIDPHQIDVYATGAWHMAYNFMDKRLIQDGIEFLEDGCKKNNSVYDLYFELGYMHYDKTKKYGKAVEAYRTGSMRGTTTGKKEAPSYVRHQLAHAIEKMGDIDQSVAQWKTNLAKAIELEKGGDTSFVSGPNTQAAQHNLYITERRRNERLAAVLLREGNAAEAIKLWQANAELAKGRLKEAGERKDVRTDQQTAEGNVERLRQGRMPAAPQTDMTLAFTVTRLGPRKIKVEGTCNALNLSRVQMLFRDRGYDERIKQGFTNKMENCTLEWDAVAINKERFSKTFDLNKDPADMDRPASDIYPLQAPDYELVLTYNPRLQAAFIQDLYGWNGEGLNSKWLKVDETWEPGILNGRQFPLRVVRRSVILTKDDILGKGQKVLFKG